MRGKRSPSRKWEPEGAKLQLVFTGGPVLSLKSVKKKKNQEKCPSSGPNEHGVTSEKEEDDAKKTNGGPKKRLVKTRKGGHQEPGRNKTDDRIT